MGVEANDNQSEIPKKEFQYIQDGHDKRIQDRLGEMVDNKFNFSYIDFDQIQLFGLEIGANEKGEIKLSGKNEGLKFLDGNDPFMRAGFRPPIIPNEVLIGKGSTFRIYNQSGLMMTIEVTETSNKKYSIQVFRKKPE